MTQEDKELLIRDICARLPYNPMVMNKNIAGGYPCEFSPYGSKTGIYLDSSKIEYTKIFLRPMSSMTEEEKSKLKEYLDAEEVDCNGFGYTEGGTLEDYVSNMPYSLCNYVIDFLNAHHFDYRGLIEKGLALEAPEGMYK